MTRRARTTMVVLACASMLVAAAAGSAFAASFHGIAVASLTAQSGIGYPMSGSVSDSFSGTGGLGGRVLASGQTWVSHSGSWSTISGNLVKTTSSSSTQLVTLPWLDVPSKVQVTLSGSGTYNGGVAMHVDASGATATVLSVRNNKSVRLLRISGGSTTTWASATVSSVPGTWALTYDSGVYTVLQNGSVVLTYTAANPVTVEANTRVGLYASGSNSSLRWASFSAVSQ